jgi:L-ribulose-5-phosphate 3-epimerase
MTDPSRRSFLGAALAGGAACLAARRAPAAVAATEFPLGMFVSLQNGDPDRTLAQVADLGLGLCELYTEELGADLAARLRKAIERHKVEVPVIFTMGPGPQFWDHKQGPPTNGLVPRPYRKQRVERLKQASDFARACGIGKLETHCGYVPEDPNDPLYKETVAALREACEHCARNGQTLLYHAGAETPVTMLRTIRDVGLDNQGIGLDTANGIMYGTGHPADALEVYGKYVRTVNPKDALWPTDPIELGREVPIGEGKVDFPRVFKKLRELNYRGPLIIEREISGPQQLADVRKAIVYLRGLMRVATKPSSDG